MCQKDKDNDSDNDSEQMLKIPSLSNAECNVPIQTQRISWICIFSTFLAVQHRFNCFWNIICLFTTLCIDWIWKFLFVFQICRQCAVQPNKSCTEKKIQIQMQIKIQNSNMQMQICKWKYTSQVQWSQLEVVEKLSNFLTQRCFLPLGQNEYNDDDCDDERRSGVSYIFSIELNSFSVSVLEKLKLKN